MILVDTSVWVDHLRRGDTRLAALLESASVLIHPFIIGEIACGSLVDRSTVIELLQNLPKATVADADEILMFIVPTTSSARAERPPRCPEAARRSSPRIGAGSGEGTVRLRA